MSTPILSRKDLFAALGQFPEGATCAELSRVVALQDASLSSRLHKLAKDGLVAREPGLGPQGGYRYFSLKHHEGWVRRAR